MLMNATLTTISVYVTQMQIVLILKDHTLAYVMLDITGSASNAMVRYNI